MEAVIAPGSYIALRLSSDALKIVQIVPDSTLTIGKFGAVNANLLIGRPFFSTYELFDHKDDDAAKPTTRLRIVPPPELNRELDLTAPEGGDVENETGGSTPMQTTDEALIIKNNRLTVDDASRQTLTMREIEALKGAVTGSGREVIEKIMSAHTNLDEKTEFSLAKYTLRKAKKFLRRFQVLPVDTARLMEWMAFSRETSRIMELREESLGLITAWSNVHYTPETLPDAREGRWLVLDDTAGLLVAALAEKMGLLHADTLEADEPAALDKQIDNAESDSEDEPMPDAPSSNINPSKRQKPAFHEKVATSNTITLLHPATQPNLSILKYFDFDPTRPSSHPLHSHLHTLSWLQLLTPNMDPTYVEPPIIPQSELASMKSGKRATYHRKRRRWQRCKTIVDKARAGEFDGLICATTMDPASVLKYLVPLIRGGGTVVWYSPTLESVAGVADLYSRERKAAFIRTFDEWRAAQEEGTEEGAGQRADAEKGDMGESRQSGAANQPTWKVEPLGTSHVPAGFEYVREDFPVDPRLLLGAAVQSSRVREWQVLPGRTHPLMTAKGGGEGYIFTARRVLPVEGKVEARGKFSKKRKTAPA